VAIKIKDTIGCNRKLIIITFEIFWIIVFVMDKVTNSNSVDIPQFIYVNF
jgi:hypothetical protein